MAAIIESTNNAHSVWDSHQLKELFVDLRLASFSDNQEENIERSTREEDTSKSKNKETLPTVSDKMSCSTCNTNFETREAQVQHFKSDWHRFNLKQKLKDFPSVAEEDFETLADDVSSISGSDSSDDESDSNVTRSSEIRARLHASNNDDDDDDEYAEIMALRRNPRVFFRNKDGELLSVYRCLLHSKKGIHMNPDELVKNMLLLPKKMMWAVFMVGGGHFAGAVFECDRVVQHKTFHRYTVRAKRGTAQGTRDGQGNAPKSAGAALRRHNEAALLQEIQDLIGEWCGELKNCSYIFLRAPSYNKTTFFGGKNPPFDKHDDRIRMIPFPTRRPTFSEVKRVHSLLSKITSHGQETDLSTIMPKPLKPAPPNNLVEENEKEKTHASPKKKSPSPPSLSEDEKIDSAEEEEFDLQFVEETISFLDLEEYGGENLRPPKQKTKRKKKKKVPDIPEPSQEIQNVIEKDSPFAGLRDALYTACKTGDSNSLLATIASLETDSSGDITMEEKLNLLLKEKQGKNEDTLLHIASRYGKSQIVKVLLEAGSDPTLRNIQNLPPFCVTNDKESRNEFRRFVARYPDRFDYTAAQIPGPLTQEMEEERKQKDTERKKQIKKVKKSRNKEQKAQEAIIKQQEEEKQRFLNLSDREKRAVAAEKRVLSQNKEANKTKKVLSRCWQCGCDITGKVPFEYMDYVFCTPKCLKEHRFKPK